MPALQQIVVPLLQDCPVATQASFDGVDPVGQQPPPGKRWPTGHRLLELANGTQNAASPGPQLDDAAGDPQYGL